MRRTAYSDVFSRVGFSAKNTERILKKYLHIVFDLGYFKVLNTRTSNKYFGYKIQCFRKKNLKYKL